MTNAIMTSEVGICIDPLILPSVLVLRLTASAGTCLASTKKNVRNRNSGPVETNLYTLQDMQKLLKGLLYSQDIC